MKVTKATLDGLEGLKPLLERAIAKCKEELGNVPSGPAPVIDLPINWPRRGNIDTNNL
jgi:hypothetical protein